MILEKEKYNEYLSNFSTESIFFNFNEKESDIIDKEYVSVVMYLDIYNFSNRIKNMEARQISDYLKKFYDYVLPIINNEYGGKIDKIIGDGIIAIFSDIFKCRNTKYNDTFKDAYFCCRKIIEKYKNTNYASKAAISRGNLFFCRIANNNYDYNEITCIGKPLTIVHRLEAITNVNEISIPKDINIPNLVDNKKLPWQKREENCELKGLDFRTVQKVRLE